MRRHAKASSAGSTSGTGSSRGLFGLLLASLLALAAFLLVPTAQALAAECPNELVREAQGVAQGATYLPDCMALEMVSPPQKSSGWVLPIGVFV